MSFSFFTFRAEILSGKYVSPARHQIGLKWCVYDEIAKKKTAQNSKSSFLLLPASVDVGGMRIIFCSENSSNPGNFKLFNFGSANSNLIQLSRDPALVLFPPSFCLFQLFRLQTEEANGIQAKFRSRRKKIESQERGTWASEVAVKIIEMKSLDSCLILASIDFRFHSLASRARLLYTRLSLLFSTTRRYFRSCFSKFKSENATFKICILFLQQ